MPILAISYDDEQQRAVLSYPERDLTWEAIRRICEEYSDDVLLDQSNISLPWFAFLAARRAIGYQLQRTSASISIEDSARALLAEVVRRSNLLDQLPELPALDTSEVVARVEGKFLSAARKLKSYQAANVARLARLDVGATFSVPGAGKTTEALAYFALRGGDDSNLLVVAPKNAFAAWEEQFSFWLFSGEFCRLTGGRRSIAQKLSRRPKFTLITYQQLANVIDLIAKHLARQPTFMFLDESHRIKGGVGRVTAKAVLSLAHLPTGKLVMSGTPLPNSISDLVPQMNFLAQERQLDETNVVAFASLLYVRTTKTDLDLPEIRRRLIPISMLPAQDRMYRALRSEAALVAGRFNLTERQRLRKLGGSAISLIQFVSNPALLLKRGTAFEALLSEVLDEGDSPKLQYTCDRARELASNGKKVIIWSSFVENVEIIAQRLADLGADYIHGGVEAGSEHEEDTREAKIKRFHDDARAMVLVANPAACSEGISLHTVCNHAIYVDRNYNAAQYLQSEDRIHRIGTDKICHVEILSCQGTVDDLVSASLTRKVDMMREVLSDPNLRIDPIPLDPEVDDFTPLDAVALLDHLTKIDENV